MAEDELALAAAESAFFCAQQAAARGDAPEAAELLAQAAERSRRPDRAAVRDADLARGRTEACAGVLHSAVHTALGEASLDRALEAGFPTVVTDGEHVRAAAAHFAEALRAWPSNARALLSLGLMERDRGRTRRALEHLEALCGLPPTPGVAARVESDGADARDRADWLECWVHDGRRAAVPAGAMTLALTRSQRGEHARATPLLRRFGFRYRLAPAIWAAAASSHLRSEPAGPDADALPVRLFERAVPARLHARLSRALAPGSAYWAQTGYNTAAAAKQYFTFFYELGAPPSNAVEQLVRELRPLLGEAAAADVSCVEWWSHTRLAGRHPGHELHYDLEEGIMESSGEVVHPRVSSVVYLTGGGEAAAGGPTFVLDQTLSSDAPARTAWLAAPRARSFLTFRGDLLHGVLPVGANGARPVAAAAAAAAAGRGARGMAAGAASPPAARRAEAERAPAASEPPPPPEHRLTLLIAWYGPEGARSRRARAGRLGPRSAVPRATRHTSWPADFAPVAPSDDGGEPAAEQQPARVRVREVSPVWEEVDGAARAGHALRHPPPELEVPPHLEQHFFLRTHADVRERLWREHGVGGTWAAAGRATATPAPTGGSSDARRTSGADSAAAAAAGASSKRPRVASAS